MKSIFTAIAPTKTVLGSVVNYLNARINAAADKISDFAKGVSGVYLPYKQYIIRAEDYFAALQDGSDPANYEGVVDAINPNGEIEQVDVAQVSQQIGDDITGADIMKAFVASLSGEDADRLNEGSVALRTYVSSKYGSLSANVSKFTDSLCEILESGSSKIDKLKQMFAFTSPTVTSSSPLTQCAAEDYTGVNPFRAYFMGPLPDFSSVGQAITAYYTVSAHIITQFYSAVFKGIGSLFSSIWKGALSVMNPFDIKFNNTCQDYSFDTGYWSRTINESDYLSNTDFQRLATYLESHDRNILCVPTLGATLYFQLTGSGSSRSITMYVKKHVYDYDSAKYVATCSGYQGQSVDSWDALTGSVNSLAPNTSGSSASDETYLFNGLIQAEYLIPLGIALISGDDSIIGSTLSLYVNGTASILHAFISPGYNPSQYNSVSVSNDEWKNEYLYGEGISDAYVLGIFGYIYVGIINNYDNSNFTPYLWTSGQLTGCASIKTDGMLKTEVEGIMKKIAIGVVVITAIVAVGVGIGKLKQAAFSAQRSAELAVYNQNLSDQAVRALSRKADLLARLSGQASNAAVNSTPALMNAYTTYKKTVEESAATRSNSNQNALSIKTHVSDDVSDVYNAVDDVGADVQTVNTNLGTLGTGIADSFTGLTTLINTLSQNSSTGISDIETAISTLQTFDSGKFGDVIDLLQGVKALIK